MEKIIQELLLMAGVTEQYAIYGKAVFVMALTTYLIVKSIRVIIIKKTETERAKGKHK